MTKSNISNKISINKDKKIYQINDKIKLGNSGLTVSRMAMGTGTDGVKGCSNQTKKLGLKGLSNLLQAGYHEGINFWDSADQYGTHPHLKDALQYIPREKVIIMTKPTSLQSRNIGISDINRFRQEIGTDYLDIVLLHALKTKDWNKTHTKSMNALSKARDKGIVKLHGVSCHSLDALETAATEPWTQVVLVKFNPFGVKMDAEPHTVSKILQKMKANGKIIISMKIFGAGTLIDKIDECLRFQFTKNFIDCFSIGLESIEQLQDIKNRLPKIFAGE